MATRIDQNPAKVDEAEGEREEGIVNALGTNNSTTRRLSSIAVAGTTTIFNLGRMSHRPKELTYIAVS